MADETTQENAAPAAESTAPETEVTAAEQTAPAAETAAEAPAEAPAAEAQADELPDALGDAKPAEETPATPAEAAPEHYENFKIGDTDVDASTVEDFTNVAKELGLSQEKAQKVFGSIVPSAEKYLHASLVKHAKEWASALETDRELGGSTHKESMAIAGAGYDHYASTELKTILKASGLSNHPEVVRHFYRLGKQLQQDKGVAGQASAPAAPMRRYPNSNMVPDLG